METTMTTITQVLWCSLSNFILSVWLSLICDNAGKEGKQMGVPAEPQAFVSHIRSLMAEVQVSWVCACACVLCQHADCSEAEGLNISAQVRGHEAKCMLSCGCK